MAKSSVKKRILVVSHHFWPESFRVTDICDYFQNKGYEIDVLCGIPNYPTGRFFDGYSYVSNRKQIRDGIYIRRAFEIPRGNNSNLRIFINYISFPIASLFHIPRLLTKKYDKIFIFQTSPVMMGVAGILLGKLKKIETTTYVLDLWPENLFSVVTVKNRILRSVVTKISHWHYRHSNKLIALSDSMKKRLLVVSDHNNDDVIVLPQACEKIYETDISDKKLAERFKEHFTILFTGSITPAQSFETIISAAKILKESRINDIRWVIVGDGMSRKWLEREVKSANLEHEFVFEGQKSVTEIPKYTTASDMLVGCLVKSNLLEATIPAKVMSYLAAGKPIVLAMDGEAQSLINDTIKCGYAGPTEDADVMASNILRIYQLSRAERKTMGLRGRNYHMKHFERNIILSKLYNFMFS